MLSVRSIIIDGITLRKDIRYRITDNVSPVIRWKLTEGTVRTVQKACRVAILSENGIVWDSGRVETDCREMPVKCILHDKLEKYTVRVCIEDDLGEKSEKEEEFYVCTKKLDFPWISAGKQNPRSVIRFKKNVELKGAVKEAYAVFCGIGYSTLMIDGEYAQTALLDPAHSDYRKTCYYAVENFTESLEEKKEFELCFEVAAGWRNIDSGFIQKNAGRDPVFTGDDMLSAYIVIRYENGTEDSFTTDDSWYWDSSSHIVEANIYDGEKYDATFSSKKNNKVTVCEKPCEKSLLMKIPPIKAFRGYRPQGIWTVNGNFIVDFGQNIAGIASIRIPAGLKKGTEITVQYSEELDEDGSVYRDILREAKATDIYVSDGKEFVWTPRYTYHGFRYASVSGLSVLTPDMITAVAVRTDIEKTGNFTCGNAILSKIHDICVKTEEANIHSILTDCPQRDERMQWLNDATVRFETFPNTFDISSMFEKVVCDVTDAQHEDGAITCTAPFVFGGLPADPVCSSYLVAANEMYKYSKNKTFLAKYIGNLEAWEKLLLSRSDDYIVNYSYYGDWAGPVASCVNDEFAVSASTPGILMSTGFSYYNCKLLSTLYAELDNTEKEAEFAALARKIRKAFLAKWYSDGIVGTGSMACQAFALWLGILPKKDEKKAARILNDLVIKNNFKITTGNLCTRYMLEMLTKFGYVNTAYKIMTDETYPGFGYMLQNEATTVWERFELKKNPTMNSHCHPMYGSVDRWFYAYILGIQVDTYGGSHVTIKPYMPDDLLSAQGNIETIYGTVFVKWSKRYGQTIVIVSIPSGMTCDIELFGEKKEISSGYYVFNSAVK